MHLGARKVPQICITLSSKNNNNKKDQETASGSGCNESTSRREKIVGNTTSKAKLNNKRSNATAKSSVVQQKLRTPKNEQIDQKMKIKVSSKSVDAAAKNRDLNQKVKHPKGETPDNVAPKPSRRNLRHGGYTTGKLPISKKNMDRLKSYAAVAAPIRVEQNLIPKIFGTDGYTKKSSRISTALGGRLKIMRHVSSNYTWLHDYNISTVVKNIYNVLTNTSDVLSHVDVSLYEYTHLALTSKDQKVANSSFAHHKTLQLFDLLIKYKLKDKETSKTYKMYKVVTFDDLDINRCFRIDQDRITGINILAVAGCLLNINFTDTVYYDVVVPASSKCLDCNPLCAEHQEMNCSSCKIACNKHFHSLRTYGFYEPMSRFGRNFVGRVHPSKVDDKSLSPYSGCGSLLDHWYTNCLAEKLENMLDDLSCIVITLKSFTYQHIE